LSNLSPKWVPGKVIKIMGLLYYLVEL